jgi:hypothetical protein
MSEHGDVWVAAVVFVLMELEWGGVEFIGDDSC